MSSRPNSPDVALSGSHTEQAGTVQVSRRKDGSILGGIETSSQQPGSTSVAAQDYDLGVSLDSELAGPTAPPAGTSAAVSEMTSDRHPRASSLAGSHGIAVYGSTASLGSASASSRREAQHQIARATGSVATTTAVGQSFGTSVYPRSTETSVVRDERPRPRSPHSRRARGQERVLSYLSEVSHVSTLTAFGEDLGVPEPPAPSAWTLARANQVDRWMRIAFWVLLICIILLSPIYVWMFRYLMGRL